MPRPVRLVLLSALMLFVELALIRWTGSNVVFLSYFSNFVLLGSFLGIGIGFLRGTARVNLFPYAPVALALLVGLVVIAPVQIDRTGSDVIYFGGFDMTGLPAWVMLPIIFAAVAAVLAMIAEGVARVFVEFEPLEAYRFDIAGSLLGIVAFALLSLTWAPPVVWGLVVAGLFLVLLRPRPRMLQYGALAALVVLLGFESTIPYWSWSPYYKITAVDFTDDGSALTDVQVNGIPHQVAAPVDYRRERSPEYFVPYDRAGAVDLGNVLIVGAGSGTDVAIALAQGARAVDAVEIDPRILQIGEQRHPDQPYADPRVETHVGDGRAFLESTDERYDLILFALPDSLTLVTGQGSLRLESYLFTVEAMEAARAQLTDGGIFSMYNYYREPWLVDRLAGTLARVYGHDPCVDTVGDVGHFAVLTIARDDAAIDCAESTWVAEDAAAAASPSTDDYPFLYLRTRSIPDFYLLTLGLILVASALMVRVVAGPMRPMRGYLDLFFMGAAFLLLETKSVIQFALLFGTTWFVNALVFAGVLLSVLAAIEVARRVRLPNPAVLYVVLLAALAVAWIVPIDALLALPPTARFLAATLLWFTPIFIANLVFAERFRHVEASNLAFGANLLGAMVGGVLEYVSLLIGYQPLVGVVAVLYGLAFLAGRLHLGARRDAAPA